MFTFVAVALLPVSLFAVVVVLTPWSSWSARAYGIALVTINVGLFVARLRRAVSFGAALVLLVLSVRLGTAAHGRSLRMTSSGGSGRSLARIVDERDAAVWGARIAFALGHFRDPETSAVVPALVKSYQELSDREGDVPSPVLPTYLGLEGGTSNDVLAFDSAAGSRGALIFLHGFGGSFTLPCWQIARAVADVGYATRCPSLGPRGDWWSADGEAIVRDTIRDLNAEGIHAIVLVGLSNGGVGAAKLAPKLHGKISGLVLISGAAAANAPGVPVLVLQGPRDAMMSAPIARAYALAHQGTYVELKGGHFALLLDQERAMRALTGWLTTH